jgi:DNA-binding CsgD family transcriptional regulator
MGNLALQDMQALQQGTLALYALHNLDTFGRDALSIVDRLVPGDIPQFHITNLRTRTISSTFLDDFSGFSSEMKTVAQKCFSEHPIAYKMPVTLTGVHKTSDFISQKELHCIESLYQQFLRLLNTEDQLIFFLKEDNLGGWQKPRKTDRILTGFSIMRDWGKFTERDRSILNLLSPHISQAYINAQKYQKLQQDLTQAQQYLDLLGMVVLDTQGRVQSIAPQAIIWLETYFPQSTYAQQLPEHLWAWVKHQVACLTTELDLPHVCAPWRIQLAGRALTIRLVVEPQRGRYLLLLEEQTLAALSSLEILGLSQRETEILGLVMQGKDNKTIAIKMNISVNTVRKHLEHIYRKFGVNSRIEAISQALEKLGFLYSLPFS